MARPFEAAKVGALVWPEIGGVGLLILGHLFSRFVDGSMGWTQSFRRTSDYAHVVGLGIPAYLAATDRAPDMMKAILYAEGGLIAGSVGNVAYNRMLGPTVLKIKSRRIAERRGGGNQGQLSEAEKRNLIETAEKRRAQGLESKALATLEI